MRIAALIVLCAVSGPACAASFDCKRAIAPDEVAICSDPKLSALDDLVGRAYGEARRGGGGFDSEDKAHALADARGFNLRKRRCGGEVGCLVSAHLGAIEDLARDGSTVSVPPTIAATDMTSSVPAESKTLPLREGGCARTHITDIGPRLEGSDFESGMSVFFANGGEQVGYEKLPALVASRKGDPVLMCLTSIPKHCPPGDGRGRFYTSTNLRTRATWSMADTEHMCGGA